MIMLAKSTDSSQLNSLSHVLWAAMEKVGHKELDATQLEEDTSHNVQLQIRGTVDGRSFEHSIHSAIEVGPAHEKSSSVNPQMAELLSLVLSKLNSATREKILAEIPIEFAESGRMPESDRSLLVQTKQMLKQLRTVKTVVARGPIRCQYSFVPDCRTRCK